MRLFHALAIGVLTAIVLIPTVVAARDNDPHDDRQPIVIGHRGASGYRPEHTLAAYKLAIDMGADLVEPDIVSTRDGVLVARHENEISGTTNVASHPEFAARRTTKTIDGTPVTGWFTEDFSLAELRTLRARERLPELRPGNTTYDGQFQVPTLQEVIDLARRESQRRGGSEDLRVVTPLDLANRPGHLFGRRQVGIYPETKHPTYFDSVGLSLEERLVAVLHRNGLRGKHAPVFIQSFETGNLRELKRMTDLPLVQLLDASGKPYDFTVKGDPRTYADMAKPDGLREIAKYADGVGANKNLVMPRDSTGKLLAPTTLVRDAHRRGLIVHLWTFRNENNFLPVDFRIGNPADPTYLRQWGNAAAEYRLFFRLGIDGLFSDFPDVAVAARSPQHNR